jgi:hypothetical protein
MTHNNRYQVDATHDAAVIGVVIAGVLVSVTIPGPFDWGGSLIGGGCPDRRGTSAAIPTGLTVRR